MSEILANGLRSLEPDIPDFLRLTSKERKELWASTPIKWKASKQEAKQEDPVTAQIRAEIEAEKRNATKHRLNALRANKLRLNAIRTKVKVRASAAALRVRSQVQGKVEGRPLGAKTQIVADLLKRAKGCTTKDILAATGWPSVSVPAMARAAGLTLIKTKGDDGVTHYTVK